MKYLFVFLLVPGNNIFAQHIDQPVQLVQYVFNEFNPGTVKMKSGETYNQLLNYNNLTGEMIFVNNGKYMAIASPENVDTIYINERKFIPLNNKFYEMLLNTDEPLLLEFTYKINEPGASTGYGGTSTTAASTPLNSLISSGGAYDLKLPDDFKVIPGYTYWIMKDGKLEKFSSAKQLIKIFPGKKNVINDFEKKSNSNFSNKKDIILLIKQIEL